MYLEIVSPEATLFAGEVISVTVPGVEGEFQMMNNHAPIVSLLQEGNVKVEGDITIEEEY
jgi:F-type H+-transporting ATPase subunit epsilon